MEREEEFITGITVGGRAHLSESATLFFRSRRRAWRDVPSLSRCFLRRIHAHRLEPGGGHAAPLLSTQLPDDPIARFEKTLGGVINLGRLVHRLQQLREKPFARIPSAIRA